MLTKIKGKSALFTVIPLAIAIISFTSIASNPENAPYRFPYEKAGLTKQQAAEHLLSRFTFGVRPGDIEKLTEAGLEDWFEQQLNGQLPNDEVVKRLSGYDALQMSNAQVLATFPRGPIVKRMALEDGFITEQQLKEADNKQVKKWYDEYRASKGLREEKELHKQFLGQKIIRAAYSNNQVQEVLTDFWFNHFNVSMTKNQCAEFIPAYERDVIRPNVTGRFENLVLATAKSPAMLFYLDNFLSMGKNEELEARQAKRLARVSKTGVPPNKQVKGKVQGLNENYAREVMELHTLGVDGGYTQQDVTEAARVLTGWTVYPMTEYGQSAQIKKTIEKIGEDKLRAVGFVHDGDFLFAVNRHDNQPKKVLGKTFKDGGYEEGVTLLKMLAQHKSTAKFISRKIATRFMSDNPPQTVVDKMAKKFVETEGDIRQVLIAMVCAPEFWSKQVLREKTKSPFEYAISSLRSLQADITDPQQVNNWITKMGQKLYYYQAPTGYPDKAQYWINTGSLLNRMNFGLALASKRIRGVSFDLAALNQYHEPESAEHALKVYSAILLPQRNLETTIKRLTPLVNDPMIDTKIDAAANKTSANNVMQMEDSDESMADNKKEKQKNKMQKNEPVSNNFGDNSMLAQVVGIIIGSPEFQRR